MAQIVPSPSAPSQPFHIVLGATGFDLDGSKKTSSYETDDVDVLTNARSHPWVEVKVEKVDLVQGDYQRTLDPAKDPLSSKHPDAKLALDPEAARAALHAALVTNPVAIDAGLDQDKVVTAGPVSETLAAADKGAEKAEKAAAASTSKEKN